MDNTQHTDAQAELIDLFLTYIEQKVTTKEVLTKAEELCRKSTLDENLLEASEKILEVRKNYDQGILTENDARYEITTVLVLLTK